MVRGAMPARACALVRTHAYSHQGTHVCAHGHAARLRSGGEQALRGACLPYAVVLYRPFIGIADGYCARPDVPALKVTASVRAF